MKSLKRAGFLVCLTVAAVQAQQPTFSTRSSYPSTYGFQGFVGDFNGDSFPDFAVQKVSQEFGLVTFFGNGDGTFTMGPSSPVANDYVQLAQTADLNGDGRLDLVYMPENARTILVCLGNGDGTFRGAVAVPTINDADIFALADVNGDGKLDVIAITYHDFLKVAFGNGDGAFQTPIQRI